MSSELQRQIQNLRAKQIQSEPVHAGKPSLFLNPKEAAGVGIEEIFDVALQGLLKLQQYDGRFVSFSETLFHPSSIHLQRELKTSSENYHLDDQIKSLMMLLSLYASEVDCHKVIEYLIRRYRVHELNSSDLLQYMLLIHDTKLSGIKDSIWMFLDGVKKSGIPLPRSVLVNQCKHDSQLLANLRDTAISAINLTRDVTSLNSPTFAGASKLVSFFTSLVAEVSHSKSLSDLQLRVVYPYLLNGFKSVIQSEGNGIIGSTNLWFQSSCIIVARICKTTPFAKPLMRSLTETIALALCAAFSSKGEIDSVGLLQVLAVICHHQKVVFEFPALKNLFSDVDVGSAVSCFVAEIEALATVFDITELIQAVSMGLCNELVKQSQPGMGVAVASIALLQLVSRQLLDSDSLVEVLETILKVLVAEVPGKMLNAPIQVGCFEVLRAITQRYPELLDRSVATVNRLIGGSSTYNAAESLMQVEEDVSNSGDDATLRQLEVSGRLSKVLQRAFAEAPFSAPSDSGLSLLVALGEQSAEVRVSALAMFSSTVPLGAAATADLRGLAAAASQNLLDGDSAVASAAWSAAVVERVAAYTDSSGFVSLCAEAVTQWAAVAIRVPKKGYNMIAAILRALAAEQVIQAICKANGSTPDSLVPGSVAYVHVSMSGAEWLLSSILALLISTKDKSFELDDGTVGTAKSGGKGTDKLRKSLINAEEAAWTCITSLASCSPPLTGLLGTLNSTATENVRKCPQTITQIAGTLAENLVRACEVYESDSPTVALLVKIAANARVAILSGLDESMVLAVLSLLAEVVIQLDGRSAVAATGSAGGTKKAKGKATRGAASATSGAEPQDAQSLVAVPHGALSLLLPLLLQCMRVDGLGSEKVKSEARRLLSEIISCVAAASGDAAFAGLKQGSDDTAQSCCGSVEDFLLSAASKPTSMMTLRYQLVMALLGSFDAGSLALVGPSLQAFFPLDPVFPLLKIALTHAAAAAAENRTEPLLNSSQFPQSTELTAEHGADASSVCTGALHALAAWLGTVDSAAIGKGDHRFGCIMLTLSLAVACSACDNDSNVRKAAISVARKISDLDSEFEVAFPTFPATSKLQIDRPPTFSDICLLSNLLLSKASTIIMDGSAATAILASIFAWKLEDISESEASVLRGLSVWAAAVVGWAAPHIASVLLAAATALPVSMTTWKCAEHVLLADALAPSAAQLSSFQSRSNSKVINSTDEESLARTLAATLAASKDSDIQVQGAVVAWITTWVKQYGSGGSPAPLAHIFLSEVLGLLASGWPQHLQSQELRNELFSVLISLQTGPATASFISGELILLAIDQVAVDEAFIAQLLFATAKQYETAHTEAFGVDGPHRVKQVKGRETLSSRMAVSGADGDSVLLSGSEMSGPLHRLVASVEVLGAALRRSTDGSQSASANQGPQRLHLSQVASVLFDLIRLTNEPGLRVVLSVEYCRSLVIDLAQFCLSSQSKEAFVSPIADAKAKPAKGKKASKALPADGADPAPYSILRIAADVEQVMESLQSARTLQLQGSGLRLLKAMMPLHPTVVQVSIAGLGRLLSDSSVSTQAGKDKLIEEILETLVAVMPDTEVDPANEAGSPSHAQGADLGQVVCQDFLRPLFTNLHALASPARSALVSMAMRAVGPEALPACTALLLSQALSSYDPEAPAVARGSSADAADGGGVDDGSSSNGEALVLLSRSAQRKAHRSMRTSIPEDLFRLAVESAISSPPEMQLINLIAQVKCAFYLLEKAVVCDAEGSVEGGPEEITTESIVDVGAEIGNQKIKIDASKLELYCGDMLALQKQAAQSTGVESEVIEGIVDSRGVCAAVALLQLEFIFEMLENKQFHYSILSLASDDDNDEDGDDGEEGEGESEPVLSRGGRIQLYLVGLSDQLLQLYSFASQVQATVFRQRNPQGKARGGQDAPPCVVVPLGAASTVRLAYSSLGKQAATSSLDILKNMQRLLDAPTFVTVLQELLAHEDSDVRKKALQMLALRLEDMGADERQNGAQRTLLLELLKPLRKVARKVLPVLQSKMTKPPVQDKDDADDDDDDVDSDDNFSPSQRVGLAQSAVLCIDILARSLGAAAPGQPCAPEMLAALSDTVLLATAIRAEVSAEDTVLDRAVGDASDEKEHWIADLLKLLGSTFLLCGTLFGAVGPKSLPHLAIVASSITGVIRDQRALVEVSCTEGDESDMQKKVSGSAEVALSPLFRARVLLLRSTLAAAASVVAAMPSFCHAHLHKLVEATVPLFALEQFAAVTVATGTGTSLTRDVERCLTFVTTKIPTRLGLPILVEVCPAMLQHGHGPALHVANLLGSIWDSLERSAVLTHMAGLCATATLLLDYRRAYGDQGPAAEDVDVAIVDAATKLCLKFTESELRTFLVRLSDWRDLNVQVNGSASASGGSAAAGGDEVDDTKISSSKKRKSSSKQISDADDEIATSKGEGAIAVAGDWRTCARGVSFFRLVSALSAKLKIIFVPCMGLFWGDAIAAVRALTQAEREAEREAESDKAAGAGGSELGGPEGKKKLSKKQRKSLLAGGSGDEGAGSQQAASAGCGPQLISELRLRAVHVLEAVKAACTYGSVTFVDEARYELMMPCLTSLLASRTSFESDAAYTAFCVEYTTPALVALAVAVGKDLLWKPLNHKVLMLARDKRKAARMVALRTLQKLFGEVGEEYLILLPECLPFLSELLEDDFEDVATLAGEVVRFVEELSGEELDAYLQ